MNQRVFYKELVSRGNIEYRLTNVIESYPDWNHEIVGYARTIDHRLRDESSVLIKFWKEVAE